MIRPYGRHHVNPPTISEPAWDSPATRALAKQACFDCHGNETKWTACARIAPASWLIQRDVNEGRAVLNFSEWQRRQEEASDVVEELLEREMPPLMYRLMHAPGSARQTATGSHTAWRSRLASRGEETDGDYR
jgi:hypothetical protein